MRAARKTLLWISLLTALGAFACAMAYRWLERGGAFDLTSVRVRGIRNLDSSLVAGSVAPLFGRPIWKIGTDSLGRALASLPGIAEVRVSRVPFHSILLEVTLEEPVFAVSDGSGTTPMSADGERLPVSFLTDTLPVLAASCPLDSAVSASVGLWFSQGGAETGAAFEYSGEGVTVILDDGCRVVLGASGLAGRWDRFAGLCRSMPDAAAWSEVDMRYRGQAVLRGGG